MTLQFHNTLTGKKDAFTPLEPNTVKMYTCGPTVYDFAHIGNFRTFVFEDLLRRFLEFKGFGVTHVMNVTDVDDKTIAGANREGRKLGDYTAVYTKAFNEDLTALNILPPSIQPHATDEIPEMIRLIGDLVAQGKAYASDGSVYFRVASFPAYGKLSGKNLEENIAGARVDVDEYEKEVASDFVLWKKAKEGEPSWDSPWGKGRPGWHIECSAMSRHHLGETIDIHAGGEDLIFPHHENEIAQSEAATGKPFVRFWLHSKFLLVNGEKMSKSKGNFFTLRDLLAKGHDPMAIRYALLCVHYRTQLNFTTESLKEAGEVLKRIRGCYFQCLSRTNSAPEEGPSGEALVARLESALNEMVKCLEDDLNISASLAQLFEAVTEINTALPGTGKESLRKVIEFFRKTDALLGLKIAAEGSVPGEVLALLAQRFEIRKNSEFKKNRELQQESDRLRAEIEKLGWLVKDSRPGEPSTVTRKN